jgi:hypothetical protein
MVVKSVMMKTAMIVSLGLCQFASALEVHEWGTFTVLSGPNALQVPWYAGANELARLPGFVSPGLGFKTGRSRVRMETPVLYFYPEKPMAVSIEVSLVNGTIAETFPHSSGGVAAPNPMTGISFSGKWTGTLHPPTDRQALANIPPIPAAESAEPYGAAREVPDAWIFQSDLKSIPDLAVQPQLPQAEKFIFYRGAGSDPIATNASVTGDVVTVQNLWDQALDFSVALRVRDGLASWVRVPHLAARPADVQATKHEVTLPPAGRPLSEVENELAAEWKAALAHHGLTPDEASAMVETWRKTWFRESGDRLLALMPQGAVDAMLPLKITPTPEKTTRVFVARIEMVSDQTAARLAAVLSGKPDAQKYADLKKIDLGRFGPGATEIAVDIENQRMTNNYYALLRFDANAGK